MHAVKTEVRLAFRQLRRVHLFDEWPARQIAVHHQLEDIIVKVGLREVPEVIVGLIKKIELVHALDPADTHLHVEVAAIVIRPAPADGVGKLVDANDVILGHDVPVIRLAVDAGDFVGRELERKLDVRAFGGLGSRGERTG
jgi:hypothetical protein